MSPSSAIGTSHQAGRYLQRVRAAAESPVEVPILTESAMWDRHGPLIWRAPAFQGAPNFYPVYRAGDLYSHSVLALLFAKGRLDPDHLAVLAAGKPGFRYLSGAITIDREIRRLGGPRLPVATLRSAEDYAQRIAFALKTDLDGIETANPGLTNVVLCGGKDSLNLLLHRWMNPVIAYSARPNFPLVEQFVSDNGLDIPVHELVDDGTPQELEDEVLVNCCRADLQHFRWGSHLRRVAREHRGRLIFWKGQVADVFMADKWRTIAHRVGGVRQYSLKVWKRVSNLMPDRLRVPVDRRLVVPGAYRSSWLRNAMMQGTHVGFLRTLTDALVLSAYHGPAVQQVWAEADLPTVAVRDIRSRVGELLCGHPVRYPETNPAPLESALRVDLHRPDRLLAALPKVGVQVGGDT